MKTTTFAIFSIIFFGILAAVATAQTSSAAANPAAETQPALSCANPLPANEAACQAMEEDILNTTARLLLYTPVMYVEGSGMRIVSSMGHGSVKDGRYLVTHNHYDETLMSILLAGDPDNLITVEILNADGEYLASITGQQLNVVLIENETVVYDLGEQDGVGLLAALGLKSASYLDQSSVTLQPGMEVAQVDWDGNAAHVDWVQVEEVTTKDGTPIINVANCVKKGASGGGVYLNGEHIGNNWSRQAQCDQATAEGTPYTRVALNSATVVAP